MKTFVMLALVSLPSFATDKVSDRWREILTEKKNCPGSCDPVGLHPEIKKAEVKVTLPCSAESKLPLVKKEQEKIQFYEPANPAAGFPLSEQGVIVRSRASVSKPGEFDVTVKYRSKSGEIKVDPESYQKLKAQSEAAETANPESPALELKCEADVAYGVDGNKSVESCSLTTTTKELTEGHATFMEMFKSSAQPLPFSQLGDYRSITIDSTSWKLDVPAANQRITDPAQQFKAKKISVEKWEINGACFLEASAKVTAAQINDGMADLVRGLKALGFDVDKEEQGQKTRKAFNAAPAGWTKSTRSPSP